MPPYYVDEAKEEMLQKYLLTICLVRCMISDNYKISERKWHNAGYEFISSAESVLRQSRLCLAVGIVC